jgi:hypothetical protein
MAIPGMEPGGLVVNTRRLSDGLCGQTGRRPGAPLAAPELSPARTENCVRLAAMEVCDLNSRASTRERAKKLVLDSVRRIDDSRHSSS